MKYFKESEFTMNNKCVFDKMDYELLCKLDLLRLYCDFPLVITSSYRSPEYNKKIGGSKNSMHIQGKAVDLKKLSDPIQESKLIYYVGKLGLGFVAEPNCYHIDTKNRFASWGWK